MVFVSMEQITIRGENVSPTVAHDITDLKQAQQALQENGRIPHAVQHSERRDFILDGPTVLDCNQKTEVMFGCTRAEFIGCSPVDYSPEMQAGGITSAARATKKRGGDGGPAPVLRVEYRRRDGSLFDAEVSLNRVEWAAGFICKAIVRDITARKQSGGSISGR